MTETLKDTSAGGLRVLVTDDDGDSAEMLQILLGLMGHRVQVARDGSSALAAVSTFDPHVVLLDISLPDMDGYEVARQIRAAHPQPIRLIALSGWAPDEAGERAREAGFDYHLTKPADPDVIERLLSEQAV